LNNCLAFNHSNQGLIYFDNSNPYKLKNNKEGDQEQYCHQELSVSTFGGPRQGFRHRVQLEELFDKENLHPNMPQILFNQDKN
jgi:hypothetical protein